jgi:hypothetical protein
MTIALHARRKQWPLEGVTIKLERSKIHSVDCAECETKEGMLDRIEREIVVSGPLDDQQRASSWRWQSDARCTGRSRRRSASARAWGHPRRQRLTSLEGGGPEAGEDVAAVTANPFRH